jgi:hypothetical protein
VSSTSSPPRLACGAQRVSCRGLNQHSRISLHWNVPEPSTRMRRLAAVDRGWECGDQRAGFCGKAVLRRRSTPDRRDNDRGPYRRLRAYLNRHPPSSRRRRVFPGTPRAFWPAERRNLEIRLKTSHAVAVPMRLFILRRVCCGVPIGSRIRGRGGWGLGRSLRW